MTTEERIRPEDVEGYRAWLAGRSSEEPEEPPPSGSRTPRLSALPADGTESLHRRLEETTDDYLLLVPPEASLYPDALQRIGAEIARGGEPDLIYADEDAQTSDGARTSPVFKPGWDPDLLLGRDYIGPVAAFRVERVRQCLTADPTPISVAAPTYDLALRIAAAADLTVVHIPRVHHWVPLQPERREVTGSNIVAEHLRRTGSAAVVEPAGTQPAWNRITWPLPEAPPRASIIVPTRDNGEVLERCARGVLDSTDYPDIELLIVDNGSVDPATLRTIEKLDADDRVRVLPHDAPYNFATHNTAAAREVTVEFLVLLNDDT